ncbi:hypothetical protein J4436_03960 [Candidatus Woesearchaeota archaeon]|nr:hypothetical protein [Candidatus Woesearchaeota archaeon]
MTSTIETIHEDLLDLKKDVTFIKNILSEEFELSDSAFNALKKARETPESEYIDL